MSRWKAAGIHLSANAVIAVLALALIFLVWYPHPYSQAAGAGTLALLLLGVDLVIGPLLTLVVYKAGKKGLRFDLTLIVLMQLGAFAYGIHVVAEARPAFVVGNIDRFSLIAANDIDPADFAMATQPQFASAPWTGPRVVGAQLPTDNEERTDLMFSGPGGKDVDVLPKYYVDYTQVAKPLLDRARPLADLTRSRADAQPLVDSWLRRHQRQMHSVRWLPLNARRTALTVLLDATTGDVLDALPLDPW